MCCLCFLLVFGATSPVLTQNNSALPGQGSTGAGASAAEASTQFVVVDVIATDVQGHPVTGLTEDGFQIVEKVGWATQVPQKIESFRVVDATRPETMKETQQTLRAPREMHGDAAASEAAEPLTILLLDNLNSDLFAPSVRGQVAGMANLDCDEAAGGSQAAPVDPTCRAVPVAVLLLGTQLEMLQDFDSDRNVLRATLSRAFQSPAPAPNLGATLAAAQQNSAPENQPASVPWIRTWDRMPKNGNTRASRIQMTMDAIRTIARHLAGYPGRKRLIWVSSSFPFSIAPDPGANRADSPVSYRSQAATVMNALANARVAVYPARPGLRSSMSAPVQANGDYFGATVPMEVFAGQTGGQACIDDVELAECFKRIVRDGLFHYEITYSLSPESRREGFHRIEVTTPIHGAHLSYRRYYSVRSVKPAGVDMELKQAACDDWMTATALKLMAEIQTVPAETNKYELAVEGKRLMADPMGGNRSRLRLHLDFAVCTFDAQGKPLQHVQYPTQHGVSLEEFESVRRDGLRRLVDFEPAAGTKSVRWVVRDSLTGDLGSVDLPYQAPSADVTEGGRTQEAKSAEASGSPSAQPRAAQTSSPAVSASVAPDVPLLEPDDEIKPYCIAIANGVEYSAALAELCRFTLSLPRKMPNVICDLETKRFWRAYNHANRDVVTATVAYENGQEHYSGIKINGAAAQTQALNSSWSMGEFASNLQMVFSPLSGAEFHFSKEVKLNSLPALVFEFHVDQPNNELYYLHAFYPGGWGVTLFPAYHGRVWLNKSTFQLMRMEKETAEIPHSFPISRASTVIDYSDVPLGDGTYFVLPGKSEIETCESGEAFECAHNVVRFANWHKFGTKSRILSIEPPR